MTILIVVALAAFVLAAFLTYRFSHPASGLYMLDHPNERSLHSRPTPRSGGVAILISVAFVSPLWIYWAGGPALVFWMGAGAALVAVLSYLDDRRGLPVIGRLLGHVIGAGLLLASGLSLSTLPLPGMDGSGAAGAGMLFSLLYLIWMTNLYNFMDGMDGFAGGMAVCGFGTFAVLGLLAGNMVFVGLSLVITAAASGFLIFNFPPARIFMGDTGSATLGLLAGGMSLWGSRAGIFPFWAALLVFSPFIVDATITLVRRLLRGERVWEAHKTHYYQRLVQLGWGHRKTVLYEYALMLACSLSAIWAVSLGKAGQLGLILFWCGLYVVLMVVITRLEKDKAGP